MSRLRSTWITACLLLPLSICQQADAYTPNSPVVKGMVQRAKETLSSSRANLPGGAALVAMALLKTGESRSHEKVQYAITECQELAATVAKRGVGNTCYNEAITCMFFCELDSQRYGKEIDILLGALLERQRENGCWAYNPYSNYDDTSQTQYGVLALWAAHMNGFEVPVDSVERAMLWLMRVQDASGGWVYKSKDPGNAARIQQTFDTDRVTPPMAAAGLGSVYIGAYLLGFSRQIKRMNSARSVPGGIPSVLRKVGTRAARSEAYLRPSSVSFTDFQTTAKIGDRWFERNQTYKFPKWTHYYMYGLERYKSFQEIVTGNREAEPAWYNAGVEFLKETQNSDGSWKSLQPAHADKTVDTAFGVLFLARGTKKSITKAIEEGRTRGGKSLPADLTNIRLKDGKVVDAVEETPTIDQLLAELEGNEANEISSAIPARLVLADDPRERAAQVARLRRMLMNGTYQARLTAAKTLGRDRSLDNIPVLIFALSDPDYRISRSARDGLRFISRKFDGFGMPEKAKRNQWQAAQAKWKAWFLSVRPDGALIE